MMRSVGFDRVIDYEREDFTKDGRRYDLILDTKTNRPPSAYVRALNPGGTYATVGGPLIRDLVKVAIFGLWSRPTMNKALRLVGLRPNRDLPYLDERFEAGQLVPVIDGPYKLSDAADAFRRFGAGNHKGKIVFTID
jgi:NADPH:quinone reductase-like Zn-dependent oxidoreductase